jgi:hypothetical protein
MIDLWCVAQVLSAAFLCGIVLGMAFTSLLDLVLDAV